MLLRNDLAWRRHESRVELAAPGPVLETLVLPSRPLDGSDVFPRFVIARAVTMMHCIEDPEVRLARSVQNLQHVRDAVVGFSNRFDEGPELTTLGNEVVVRINYE